MALRDEDMVELVNDQTKQDDASNDVPFLANGPDCCPASVPEGEKWLLASITATNTANGAQDAVVWLVPEDKEITSATTEWRVIPNTRIAGESSVSVVPIEGSKVARVMTPGDSVWIMGGGLNINVVVMGWKVPA